MIWFVLSEVSKMDLSMQRWMFGTTALTLGVVVAKWWTDQKTNKEIKQKTKETVEVAHEAKNELKRDILQNTQISREAFTAANALNEKILATQLNIEKIQARQAEQASRLAKIEEETDQKITGIIKRLDHKQQRIHEIANMVHSIKLGLAVPDAPPIAGEGAKPDETPNK